MKTNLLTNIFLLAAFFVAQNISAYDFSEENEDGVTIYYNVLNENQKTCEVTWMQEGRDFNKPDIFTDYVGEVNIPSSANGYQVTQIGKKAFTRCSNLTSVSIPNSITIIEEGAFYACVGLTSLVIPNSVAYIGDFSFDRCTGLTSLTIGESVGYIGTCAFFGCNGLTSLVLPNVKTIRNQAFSGCSGLTSLDLGNSLVRIGWSAFSGLSGITSLTIPETVTTIEDHVFSGCKSLISVTIPKSVTKMGANPFMNCANLTSIVVEEGNPKYNSISTCNAVIETSTKKLITGLKNLVIPDYITSIGEYAFGYCEGLNSIVIPNSVTSIENGAFFHCEDLTSVSLPNSLVSIGVYAFQDCTSLESIDIPNSVTTIKNQAFWGCSSLASVSIGNSVETIGGYAFLDCIGLTTLTIPNSVTSIEQMAFGGCKGLTTVKSYITDVFVTGSSAFTGCQNATLYVPVGLKSTYQSTADWNRFTNIEELPGISLTLACSDQGKVVINDVMTYTNMVGEVTVYDGTENKFVFTPEENCKLDRVLVNGLDVSKSVKNNQLTTTLLPNSTIMVIFTPNGADVNGDGQIDISDVVALVNIILGQ